MKMPSALLSSTTLPFLLYLLLLSTPTHYHPTQLRNGVNNNPEVNGDVIDQNRKRKKLVPLLPPLFLSQWSSSHLVPSTLNERPIFHKAVVVKHKHNKEMVHCVAVVTHVTQKVNMLTHCFATDAIHPILLVNMMVYSPANDVTLLIHMVFIVVLTLIIVVVMMMMMTPTLAHDRHLQLLPPPLLLVLLLYLNLLTHRYLLSLPTHNSLLLLLGLVLGLPLLLLRLQPSPPQQALPPHLHTMLLLLPRFSLIPPMQLQQVPAAAVVVPVRLSNVLNVC
jgi:hypothetical protein